MCVPCVGYLQLLAQGVGERLWHERSGAFTYLGYSYGEGADRALAQPAGVQWCAERTYQCQQIRWELSKWRPSALSVAR